MHDGDDKEDVIAYGDEVSGIIHGTPERLCLFRIVLFLPYKIFSNLFYL